MQGYQNILDMSEYLRHVRIFQTLDIVVCTYLVMCPKDAVGMAINVDPDQTAGERAI